jgi:hypothetical protein
MNFSNIIPLGDNCAIATILKELGIRNKSYPFDWISHVGPNPTYSIIETNINLLIHLIESGDCGKILYYMLQNNIDENQHINGDIIYPHEKGSIEETNEKYLRRIQRLYDDITDIENNNLFIMITRGYFVEENVIIKLYNTIMKLNKNNQLLFISGVEHPYIHFMKLDNMIFKYIYYDISRGWEPDYSHFRPEMKSYLSSLFIL